MDHSKLLKGLLAVLVSVIAWIAIEIYNDVRDSEERDRAQSDRISRLEGALDEIREIQRDFRRSVINRALAPIENKEQAIVPE